MFQPKRQQHRHHRHHHHHNHLYRTPTVKIIICTTLLVLISGHASASTNCKPLQPNTLANVLGGAFNARYMSIERPAAAGDDQPTSATARRPQRELGAPDPQLAFAVDGNEFHPEPSLVPAWQQLFGTTQHARVRRHAAATSDSPPPPPQSAAAADALRRPWACQAHIRWLDLGADYFPRFLRTVECAKQSCWYGHFTCRPRSFLVRLLRRRSGECAPAAGGGEPLMDDGYMPGELRELWTWEERAVNFCCDCAVV